jgi:hypothetical protein
MKLRSLIFVLLFSILTIGCSTQTVVTEYKEVQKTPLDLPKYPSIKFEEVNFVVLNNDKVYFALTAEEYGKLSRNMQTTKNYIQYLKSSLDQYKQYYEGGDDGSGK